MYINDETLDEMASTIAPCTCDTCAMSDPDMAFLFAEMGWEGSGL